MARGWLWSSINADGTIKAYGRDYSAGDAVFADRASILRLWQRYDKGLATKAKWTHFAMIFDRDALRHVHSCISTARKLKAHGNITGCSDYDNNMTMQQQGNTDDYVNAYKRLKDSNLIIVGGNRHTGRGHGGNGLVGVLDEFRFGAKQ